MDLGHQERAVMRNTAFSTALAMIVALCASMSFGQSNSHRSEPAISAGHSTADIDKLTSEFELADQSQEIPGGFGPKSITDIVDPRGSIRPQLDWRLGLGVFQPEWSSEGFKSIVPTAAGPAFGFTGKGRIDDFDYKPALTVNFQAKLPAALGEGTAIAYTRLELIGRLNENPESNATRAFFDTSSVIRNEEFRMQLMEWNYPPVIERAGDAPLLVEHDVRRSTFLLDISYRDMYQQFNSTLTRGGNVSQLRSEAHFQGVGVTPVLKLRFPFYPTGSSPQILTTTETVTKEGTTHVFETQKHLAPFALFLTLAGNFAIGENERFSSRIVTVVTPGALTSDDRSRLNRTEFVASGGVDFGFEWNQVRNNKLFSAILAATVEGTSNIGPIDPADQTPGSNHFLLYGLILAGALSF